MLQCRGWQCELAGGDGEGEGGSGESCSDWSVLTILASHWSGGALPAAPQQVQGEGQEQQQCPGCPGVQSCPGNGNLNSFLFTDLSSLSGHARAAAGG